MNQYTSLVKHVIENGTKRINERTGEATLSVFGHQMRYDLSKNFPLENQKFTPFYLTTSELLWFLAGCTDNQVLHKFNNTIWDEWADANHNLNKIYGYQWRSWENGWDNIDQIELLIENLKKNPHDRGHIVSAWNVGCLDEMALRPCHTMFQFYVADNKLSCQLYQRSADLALGISLNTASYSMLTHIIARICDLEVGEFIHTIGDAHVYEKHIPGLQTMISRPELENNTQLWINPDLKTLKDFSIYNFNSLADLKLNFKVEGYEYHPAIHFEITV